ncbi:MAG: Ger(x)C family spore germination protein [Bacillota bacterium]
MKRRGRPTAKWLLALALAVTQLLPTGCWSRRELTDIALVTACAVDLAENDLVEVTVVLEHPGHAPGGTESGGKPTMVLIDSEKAPSVQTAVTRLATHSSKKPYWSHANILLIGEDMARKGVAPVLDWFDRNPEPRRLIWLLVTPGRARDVFLKVTAEPAYSPADLIYQTIRILDEASLAIVPNIHEFSKWLLTPGCDPLAGRLELTTGPDGATRPAILGAAVFREDKLAGWLDPEETRGLMWARNRVRVGTIELPWARL